VCKGPCALCVGHLEGSECQLAAYRAGSECKMGPGAEAQIQKEQCLGPF
jgi:hypothetical protein